jgi:hypothetical protein
MVSKSPWSSHRAGGVLHTCPSLAHSRFASGRGPKQLTQAALLDISDYLHEWPVLCVFNTHMAYRCGSP